MADEEITIRVALEDELSRPAKTAEHSIEDIGDAARDATVELEVMGETGKRANNKVRDSAAEAALAQKRAQSAGMAWAKTLREAHAENAKFDADLKKNDKTFKDFAKTIEKITQPFGKAFDQIFKFSNLFKLIKFTAIIQGIHLLMLAIAALGGMTFIAASKAVPFIGGLTAYPGLALAAAQAMGVFKIVMGGMGPALKDLASGQVDINQLNKDLGNLGPNATAAVYQLAALNKTYLAPMKQSVQESFWGAVDGSLGHLAGIAPVVTRGLQGTGYVLGNIVKNGLELADSPLFKGDLATVMNTNNIVLGNMGTGVLHLVSAFIRFMVLARPFLIWMSQAFDRQTQALDNWIHSFDGTNAVTNFLDKTRKSYTDLGTILHNFFTIFMNMSRAAEGTTSSWGDSLAKVTGQWAQWTGSIGGQNKLHDYFQWASSAMSAAWKFAKAAFDVIVKLNQIPGGFLDNLKLMAPIIEGLFKGKSGKQFADGLNQIGTAVSQIILDLTPTAITVLQAFVKILAGIAKFAAAHPNVVKFALALVVLGKGIRLLALAIAFFDTPFGIFTAELLANPITWIILLIAAAIFELIYIWTHWGELVRNFKTDWDALTNKIPGLQYVLLFLLGPIGQVIAVMLLLKNHIKDIAAVFGWVISKGWDFITFWVTLPDKILAALGDGASLLYDWGKNLMSGIGNGMKKAYDGLPGWAKTALGAAVPEIGLAKAGIDLGKSITGSQITLNIPVPGAKPTANSTVQKASGTKTRWSGGSVSPFSNYLVGEKGLELFRDALGRVMEIGANGPEMMKFNMPGVVIPHHEVADYTRKHEPQPVVNMPKHAPSQNTDARQFHMPISASGDPEELARIVRRELKRMMAAEDPSRTIHWGNR